VSALGRASVSFVVKGMAATFSFLFAFFARAVNACDAVSWVSCRALTSAKRTLPLAKELVIRGERDYRRHAECSIYAL